MLQKRERKKEKEANEIVSENNTAACNDIDLLVPVEEFCNIFPGLLLFLILGCESGSVTLYHPLHTSRATGNGSYGPVTWKKTQNGLQAKSHIRQNQTKGSLHRYLYAR